ncbi:hypothetical protein [Agromyces neolithicus]|uniref:Uncharacterized protein n=1 Tax=Agromyces neolithicus TaxID=269420 RepID=A0ABN2M9B4_9MICO
MAVQLLVRCREYRHRELDLDALKSEIWSAAAQIVVPDERVLRGFLQKVEGKLDMLQFTVDEPEIRQASLEVVAVIEARLASYLTDGDE